MKAPGELGTNPAAAAGFVCAVLAVLAALFTYWLWAPSIALGAVAVGLGCGPEAGADGISGS